MRLCLAESPGHGSLTLGTGLGLVYNTVRFVKRRIVDNCASLPGGDTNTRGTQQMKIILLDYVYKHGVAGEVIDVADGYARNFLIPKGLAVQATPGELKRAEKLREQAAARRAALDNKMNELARIIDGVELIFGRRAASTGKLFGSVTTQEIADALLEKTAVDINRRRISQQQLREIGTHEVPVRLGTDLSPILQITIVREEELAETLAAREAAARGEEVDAEATEVAAEAPAEVVSVDEAAAEATEAAAEAPADMETEILPMSAVNEAIERLNEETGEAADEEKPE